MKRYDTIISLISFMTITLIISCGQNKIKQTQKFDIASINSKMPSAKLFTPSSFIEAATIKDNDDTTLKIITIENDFPIDWVKDSDIPTLLTMINSTKKCYCYMNPLSSYIPTKCNANVGGYAIIFINSFRNKTKIDLGLNNSPLTDKKSVEEITKWWLTKRKIK